MYKFSFQQNTAYVQEVDVDGNFVANVLVQPFKPTFGTPEQWSSAEEAEAWVRANYGGYFIENAPSEDTPPTE